MAADLDKQRLWLDHRVRELEEEIRLAHAVPPPAALEGELRETRLERDRLAEMLRTARLERDHLAETLGSVIGTLTWRLREKLARVPGFQAVHRKILRKVRRPPTMSSAM